MELVDRYLYAVKFWLPRNQKEDIIAELSEDLCSQIEEKESEFGRKLDDSQVEAILRQCGSPMVVAQRYLPQRSLIGPALFPIYRMVIRSLIFYFLLPWLLLWLGISIFSPDFRADHAGAAILSLDPWRLACTYSLFFCTLVFAWLERSQMRSHVVNDWNPRSLPVVRDPDQISRGSTIFEITFSVATLALWIQLSGYERMFHIFGVTITFGRAWPWFFWALTAVSGLGIAVACLNLTRRRWTRAAATLRLGIDIYSFGLFYWIFKSNPLQSLSASSLSPSAAGQLLNSINYWASISAIWVLVIGAIVLFFDIRRILRVGA
jgi:hypothetical protein